MFPVLIDAGWQSGAVGFTTAKGSDVIGALEELTAWIMEVSLGPVGNDLACYKLWLSNLNWSMLVIVFRARVFLPFLIHSVPYISEEFPWNQIHNLS